MNKRTGLLLVVVLCLIFLFSFYGKVLLHPNQYLFGKNEDGIKNYYTYVYYVANNHSSVQFEGFNYPYGEHFFYTDCQPGLAVFFKLVSSIFPGILAYNVGILNMMMLGSFIIGAVFLFLVFMELKTPVLLGVLGSVAIMVLSPQIFRMVGHYGLSYACFIPITLYLLLRFEHTNRKLLFAMLLFVNSLFWFFIHAYLGMVLSGFLFLYMLFKLLGTFRNRKYVWRHIVWLNIPVVFPFLTFFFFLKITDLHTGRSSNPYGFFEYYADFDTLLIPHHGILKQWIKSLLPNFTQTWEGWVYIGVISIVFIGTSIGFIFYSLVKTKTLHKYTQYFNHPILTRMLAAASILLLFSFGFPFRYGLKEYLEYFPMIKQFRSIGRFAWIFYFLINISAIYFVGRWVQKWFSDKKPYFAYLLIALVPAIICFEGLPYHQEVSEQICQTPNLFKADLLPQEVQTSLGAIHTPNYQAIIPLPFYCIGSENFERHGTQEIYVWSMVMSYYTQLPILGGYLARSSILEDKKLMQTLTYDFYPKPIQNDISSNLPFLVIYTRQHLSETEQELFKKSKPIIQNQFFEIAEISKQDLFNDGSEREIKTFKRLEKDLIEKDGFLSMDTAGFVLYNSFDTHGSTHILRGAGAFERMKNDESVVAEVDSKYLQSGKTYVAGIWMYNNGPNDGQDELNNTDFVCRKMVGRSQQQTWKIRSYNSLIINGNWTLVEIEFIPDEIPAQYEFVVKGYDYKNRPNFIDELFIYPKGSVYYKVEEKTDGEIKRLFKNNHEIIIHTNN